MLGSPPTRQVPKTNAPRRYLALAVAAAAVVFLPSLAQADAATEAATAKELTKPAERRSGVVLGFGVGLGLAGASGYPNSASKIGVPAYYDGSDVMGGWGGGVFLQGALTDWLNFGFFYKRANFRSGQWSSYGGGGGVRVDLFPLYRLYPPLRDLGVSGQFGIGTATLSPISGDREASTGTESFIGAGVFYEFFLGRGLGGHFAAGPTFEYDAEITQSNERHGALFGGRVVLYTGR
jgi:hypothetical protein